MGSTDDKVVLQIKVPLRALLIRIPNGFGTQEGSQCRKLPI